MITKIKSKLKQILFSHKKTILVNSTYGDMYSYKYDLITDQIKQYGTHTRPGIAMLLSVIRPGDRIFDIGAHIGTFTIPLSKKTGQTGRVLSIEGSAENCRLLEKNISINNCDNTTAKRAIVGLKHLKLQLNDENINTGASSAVVSDDAGETPVSLDDLCREYFEPDVIKIDVEGLEAAILLDSKELIRIKPIIYAEFIRSKIKAYGGSAEEFNRLFSDNGYALFMNDGPRNADNDCFQIKPIESLATGGKFFDFLAIHKDDDRMKFVR